MGPALLSFILMPCEKCVGLLILTQKIGSVLRSSSLFNAGLVFYVLTLHLTPGSLNVINLLSVYPDGQLVYQGHLLRPHVCHTGMLFTANFLWVPLCWHLQSSSPPFFLFLSLEAHLPEGSRPSSSPTVCLYLGVWRHLASPLLVSEFPFSEVFQEFWLTFRLPSWLSGCIGVSFCSAGLSPPAAHMLNTYLSSTNKLKPF